VVKIKDCESFLCLEMFTFAKPVIGGLHLTGFKTC
jgi:hypothetical protein